MNYFLFFALFLQGCFAGVPEDILWQKDLVAFVGGTFKPINKNLPVMPDSQTILTTKNDSKITIGEEAESQSLIVEQNGLRVFSNEAYLRLDDNNRMEVLELMARSKYQNDKLLIWASSGVLNIAESNLCLNRGHVSYPGRVENIWGQAKSVSRDDKRRYYFHEPTMSFYLPMVMCGR